MRKDNMSVVAPDGVTYSLNDLLSVKNVMDIFNVTRVTVYNWLGKCSESNAYEDGKFKHAFKFGGMIYIPYEDIKNEIDKKQAGI